MDRERITISIRKRVLSAIDKTIDGVNIRNRSHAIETLSLSALSFKDSEHALILMGGDDAVKMIPMVKNNLKILAKNGFESVHIALGYLADQIKEKLGDGEDFKLSLEYIEGGEGSGGSLSPLKEIFDRTFIVLNNIDLSKIDFNRCLSDHKDFKGIATVITDNLDELNGFYIFEPEVFKVIPKGFSMLENDIFPKLIKQGQLVIKPF